MVEIEGERVLAASCIRKPTQDMKVHTGSDRAISARRLIFEMLEADQPSRDKAHDPESRFWQWTDQVQPETNRIPSRKNSYSGPKSCSDASISRCLHSL